MTRQLAVLVAFVKRCLFGLVWLWFAGGMSVGAANFLQTPGYGQSPAILEDFSSWGVQPIFYSATGVMLPQPTV